MSTNYVEHTTVQLHSEMQPQLSQRGKKWDGIYLTCRTRAIISRGLYFFYPIFTLAAAYIADNLCTKNGNSSFFKLKIRGL